MFKLMWMNWAYGFGMCKTWIWMHVHRLPQMHKYPNISKWRWKIYPNISKYCKYIVAGWEMDRNGQSIPIYRWYPAGLRYPCWSHTPGVCSNPRCQKPLETLEFFCEARSWRWRISWLRKDPYRKPQVESWQVVLLYYLNGFYFSWL